jgi:hypothetical protein
MNDHVLLDPFCPDDVNQNRVVHHTVPNPQKGQSKTERSLYSIPRDWLVGWLVGWLAT